MVIYDIIGNSIGGVGIVKMNKEYRNNILTPQYVKQVARGIESMNIDHFVKLIYLTTSQGKHFSNGTDFRTVLQFVEEKKHDQLADYMADIFKLQATMAKINKPILAAAPGHSYNSGLGVLSACSLPAISHNTRVAYNECTFGFVPHAGTTFYASRMLGDFGTFMVLTGTSIHGKDAINVGIAELLIDQPETYDEDVIDIITNISPGTLPGSREVHDARGFQQYQKNINHEIETEFKVGQMLKTEKSYASEARRRQKFFHHDELFVDPKERKPDIVAEADIEYEQILKRHSQGNFGKGGQSYFSHIPEQFNQFQYINDYVKSMLGDKYQEEIVNTLLKHRQLIDRCFWPSSIEEIMENLRNEDDKFAKEILQRMESNSMLSMKLALKMIRKAKNMCFRDVLNMELNVALNKVQDSDFKIGVENILMKPNNYGKHIARSNPGFLKVVPNEMIESYFKQNEYAKKIDLDIIENSLLPTRHYFNTHTDSLRIYVNETSTNQEDVRDAVEMEIKEVLRYQGIDLRNKTLTIPQIRKLIYQKEREKMNEEEQLKRAMQLLSDQKLRNNYFDKIISHVNLIDQNETMFYELVNNKISNIFENAFLQRLDQIYKKSQEAHGLEKRRMFIKFKKFLIRSRILQFTQEEALRQDIQISALPFKLPHMSEKWDESFRDQEHPQIQRSIMYHLSKVIGKATIAPYESIKLFLTDPIAAKSLSTYVFDKQQLENLRKDLIENSEKYEQILTQEDEYDPFYGPSDVAGLTMLQELKAENQQYKFRLYNDGWIESLRNWPWRVQYHQYKNWSSEIKKKSLDTLKYTVQRLIFDFQNDQFIGNKVEDFNEKKGESKRQKLERLLDLLNQKEEDAIQHVTKQKQKDDRTLNQKTISVKSLKDEFSQLIEDDKDLKNLLGSKELAQKNSLVSKFRENLMSQLLQLIETVLISSENKGINISEKELEQRLTQVLQPKNIKNDNQIQLGIIDSYLFQKNSQNTLQKTFEFVKPFFIEMILKEIEIETEKVLDGFQINKMNIEVIHKYLLYKNNPHMFEFGIFEKVEQYNEINEIENHIREHEPTESAKFIAANAYQKIGQNIDDAKSGLTTKQRELKIIENAKEHMILASLISHKQNIIDEKLQKVIVDENAKSLSSPFQGHNKYIEKAGKALNGSEMELLNIFLQYSKDINQFLANNQYEMNSTLKPHDWLLMCSELVSNFNVDMNQFMHSVLPKDQIVNDLQNGYSNQENVLKNKFNDKNLTWEQLAEYGNYLTNFLKEKAKFQNSEKYQQNYKKVIEFMLQTDKNENQDLTRESLFQTIINQNFIQDQGKLANYKNSNEISDLKQFQKLISEKAKLKLEILRITQFLNEDTKNEIENLLQFESKYLNLQSILQKVQKLHQKTKSDQKLKNKEYLRIENFIDKNQILRDIQKGNLLEDFVQKFNDYKLDVVSMAEIRQIVNLGIKESQENNQKQNIEFLLTHLENQLQYVSNSRREQISLGQFLSRHHYFNDDSLRKYSNELLQVQLENALGKSLKEDEINAQFDNQLAGILSHPAIDNQSQLNRELDIQIDEVIHDASKGKDTKNIKNKIAVQDLGRESYSIKDKADDIRKKCIQSAQKLTDLNKEMETIKNLYENKFLIEFTKAQMNQEQIEHLIKEYMQARYNDCMLKKEFSEAMKTDNKHIYLKVLRQRVFEEMKLSESMDIQELSWVNSEENAHINQKPQYVTDSLYNLDQINNEEAIGFSNLMERSADLENNKNIAHQSVFDKLLADYFLQARSQHKKGNKLLTDLEEIFGNFTSPSQSGEKARKYDEKSKLEGQTGDHSLGLQYQLQATDKDDKPFLPMYNFKALMDLDITINKYFYDGKSGLSQQMRNKPDKIELIPDFYEFHDVRMPADLYVTQKLDIILEQLFEARKKIEKYLSRQELIAYDQSMLRYLNKQSLMEKLRRDLYKDYNQIDLMEQGFNHLRDSDKSMQVQLMKTKNEQPKFNQDVVNEDSFYKFLAYTGNLEKQRRENHKQTLNNYELLGGEQSFEQFYQKQLLDSAKNPPRPINQDDYVPKRKKITEELYLKEKSNGQDDDLGYMSRAQKQEKFFEDHSLYQENQLEQKERIELFFVLQKFFDDQNQNKNTDHNDPLFKAQESIKDYFSKPENTNFFEKNKIY